MRIYISSTFEDLKEHRLATAQILRQLGHEVVAMEDYTAANDIPLDAVLDDVKSCDLYVGIFAWRYGYIPDKGPSKVKLKNTKAKATSITEYEYRQALASGKPVLAFLLEERATWPVYFVDREPKKAAAISALRSELQRNRLVAFFSSPDQLAARVAASVSTSSMRAEVRRQLIAPVGARMIDAFTNHSYLTDSHTIPIMNLIDSAEPWEAVIIDLSTVWWSTRLYLLAGLGQQLASLQRILLYDGNGFIGILSTSTIRWIMRQVHPVINKYENQVLNKSGGINERRTIDDYIDLWNKTIGADFGANANKEAAITRIVTRSNLNTWFGEAMLSTVVQIDDLKLATALDLLRIIDYPNDYVPISSTKSRKKYPIQLVNKRLLSTHLARGSITEMLDRLGIR